MLNEEQAMEVLRLHVLDISTQLETIISEFQMFNHSKYVYPLYERFQQQLDEYIQQGHTHELDELLERSQNDPTIKDLLWEYSEYTNPIAVQKVRIKQMSNERRSIGSQAQINGSDSDQEMQEPLTVIRQFDQASYAQEINFIPLPTQTIKDVIEERIRQSKSLYEDALLDDAHMVLQQAEKDVENDSTLKDWMYENHGEYIQSINEKMHHLQVNLKELQSDGWTIEKQTKTLTIKYKILPETRTVTLYMDSVFDANITRLMCLINEIELYQNYVPFCMQSRMPKEFNKSTKICDLLLYFPLISDRRMTFIGEGIDRLKIDGTIIFICKRVPDLTVFGIPKTQDHDKYVELILNYYIFELTPLSKDKCRVRAVTNANPQITFLPSALVTLVARKMAHTLFDKMQKITKNFETSPWFQRYNENKAFYEWIETKVNRHFQA